MKKDHAKNASMTHDEWQRDWFLTLSVQSFIRTYPALWGDKESRKETRDMKCRSLRSYHTERHGKSSLGAEGFPSSFQDVQAIFNFWKIIIITNYNNYIIIIILVIYYNGYNNQWLLVIYYNNYYNGYFWSLITNLLILRVK